jgi:hypothetical protein
VITRRQVGLTKPPSASFLLPHAPTLAQLAFQILNLAMIVFSALMIWKALMFMTKSESPVVVVLR